MGSSPQSLKGTTYIPKNPLKMKGHGTASQKFLDSQQYTRKGILLYEKIFGYTYLSTGGKDTTERFCANLNLKPGQKVLDIGCGTGGSAFYMARRYGVDVYGIDLSQNMIDIAVDYRKKMEPGVQHRVQFYVEDATKMAYPDSYYDVVYSRDTILHVDNKQAMFENFLRCLKPGGILLISDYCRGDQKHSKKFEDYVKQRGYNLLTVKEYGRTLERAGFSDVEALDNSKYFIEILNGEVQKFEPMKNQVAA